MNREKDPMPRLIHDDFFSYEIIETAKNKLKILKDRGSDTHGFFKSFFYFFSVDQTPNFLEFFKWCVNKYSEAERVIMNKPKSRILFPIQAYFIRKALFIPNDFIPLSEEYKEENFIHFF